MKTLLSIIIALWSFSAMAQDKPTCVSPETVLTKAEIPLKFRLEDSDLVAFNNNYELIFHRPAPKDDLILILGANDEGPWWLIAFNEGCAVFEPVQIMPQMFFEIRDGKPL